MEWFTGLALVPVLACAVMMGGTALAAVFGLRHARPHTHTGPATPPAPGLDTERSDEPERAAR